MRAAALRLLASLLLAALAAGCGGGGGGGGGVEPADPVLHDDTPYSTAANASLPSANEASVTTTGKVTIAGTTVDYVATTGHLNALAPVSATPQASMFYVAYVRPAPAGTVRPLVFFYNGGPGSASVWLHLGSFAPRRIVTSAPATTVPQPFQLVDNAESLIDVADLVFVDAVGTGYSQAIAPFTNRSFWGVDSDAALMRDFIARYVAVNQPRGVAHLPVRRVVRRPARRRARPPHARRRHAARRRDPAVAGPRLQLELRRVRAGDDQLRRLLPELRPDRGLVRADPAGADRCRRLRRASCATSPPPPTDRRRRRGRRPAPRPRRRC